MPCRPDNVMCFGCGTWFKKATAVRQCKVCGDYKCPSCGACICNLTKGEKRVVMSLMRTYERYVHEKYGEEEYDFEKHKKIEAGLF